MATQVAGRIVRDEHGLYECPEPDCDKRHPSALAAALCCDETYEPDDH